MKKMRWIYLTAAIIFFLFMLALGSLPGNAQSVTEIINDKVLHFLAYSLLTVLIYLSLRTTKLGKFIITLSVILVLGMTDELIQSILSFRNASLLDLIVDLLAAFLMTSCLSLLKIDTEIKCNI